MGNPLWLPIIRAATGGRPYVRQDPRQNSEGARLCAPTSDNLGVMNYPSTLKSGQYGRNILEGQKASRILVKGDRSSRLSGCFQHLFNPAHGLGL